MNISSPIKRLRLAAILEGISYLLFAITMPLKYLYSIEQPNYIVGMAHGFLFIAYGLLCLQNIFIYKWKWNIALLVLAASLFPLATFVADARVFKPADEKGAH